MCGRAKLTTPGDEIARAFGLDDVPLLEPRYNVAPTQPIAAVRPSGRAEGRVLHELRWGLIPYWAKDARIGVSCINARVETVTTKSHFKEPFRSRRCLVVADGFYEWQRQGKTKRPHHIHPATGGVFAFAGLWDRWVSSEGEVVESCAIVTTAAQGEIRTLHDRMPVFVAPEDHAAWLSTDTPTPDLEAILAKPPPSLSLDPVSTYVNKADNEGPACLRPEGATNLTLDFDTH